MDLMKVDRDFTPLYQKIFKGMVQSLNYSFMGDGFNIKRYISLVLDVSRGMNTHKLNEVQTRFEVLKQCAEWVIRKFQGTDTRICIVSYSDKVKNSTELLDMRDSSNVVTLLQLIGELQPDGNSNIGDGIRKAYWKLKNSPSDAVKSIFVLTDGETNMFTTVSKHMYPEINILGGSIDYELGDGDANYIYANYLKSVEYGKRIGEMVASEKYIKPYFISLSTEVPYKLQEIARASGAEQVLGGKYFYTVKSVDDIDSVYESVMNSIDKSLSVSMSFKDVFPEGIEVLEFPNDFKLNVSNELSGSIKEIPIIKDEISSIYSIKPFKLIVKIKYNTIGSMLLNSLDIGYKDQYGNLSEAKILSVPSFEVYEDKVSPDTECILRDNEGYKQIYFNSDVTVELIASDAPGGSGLLKTEYKINDMDWIQYESKFSLSEEGKYIIYFRSIDLVNNVEAIKNREFYIDKTPPVSKCVLDGTKGSGYWYISDVKVSFTSDDNVTGCGVYKIEYSYDEVNWIEYTSSNISISKEGLTNLFYRSIDNAGNIEDSNKKEIYIDKEDPILTAPPDIKIKASGDYIHIENIGSAKAEDISGVALITHDDPVLFHRGITTINWTAIDTNKHISKATQMVNFISIDKEPQYTHGVTDNGELGLKIWVKFNNVSKERVKLICIIDNWKFNIFEMKKVDNVWEKLLSGVSKKSEIRYCFVYEDSDRLQNNLMNMSIFQQFTFSHSLYTSWYSYLDGVVTSDFIKKVENLSNKEARIRFTPQNLETSYVKLYYKIDEKNLDILMAKNNEEFYQNFTELSNNKVIKYRFEYKRAGYVYLSEWFEYMHYRE